MQVQDILISAIQWPTRLRAINPQRVEALKSSMAELGLINPITVYLDRNDDPVLAAGAHRVKAAQALGWKSIAATIMDGEELDRELAEIDENLCRFELSPAQRALHMSRRKELWTAKQAAKRAATNTPSATDRVDAKLGDQNSVTQLDHERLMDDQSMPSERDARGQQLSPQQQPGFAATTAMLTGDSKTTINCNVQRGEVLGDALLDIARTSLDKGVELDAMMKLPPEEREDLARRAKAGEEVSARKTLEARTMAPEGQNKALAKRALLALGKCASVMDEREFGSALQDVEVPGTVARLAEQIVKHAA